MPTMYAIIVCAHLENEKKTLNLIYFWTSKKIVERENGGEIPNDYLFMFCLFILKRIDHL